MHEFDLMQSTLILAANHARQRGAVRICRLVLKVGRLSGVEPAALDFAFQSLAGTTMAAGATLAIVDVATTCFCRSCNCEFEATDWDFRCPWCQVASTDIRRGRELELTEIEVV